MASAPASRLLAPVLGSLLLVLVLTGCYSVGDEASDGGEIRFAPAGDADELASEPMVVEFEDSNPDVDVAHEQVPGSGDLADDLSAASEASDLPDVFVVDRQAYRVLLKQGAIEPVQDYAEDSTVTELGDYPDATLAAFSAEAGLACLPRSSPSPPGTAYCIAATSEHQQAAWRLIEFAESAEGRRLRAPSGDPVP